LGEVLFWIGELRGEKGIEGGIVRGLGERVFWECVEGVGYPTFSIIFRFRFVKWGRFYVDFKGFFEIYGKNANLYKKFSFI